MPTRVATDGIAPKGLVPPPLTVVESVTVAPALPALAMLKGVLAVVDAGMVPKEMLDWLTVKIAPCAVSCSAMRCGVSPKAVVVTVSVSAYLSVVVSDEAGMAFGVTVI